MAVKVPVRTKRPEVVCDIAQKGEREKMAAMAFAWRHFCRDVGKLGDQLTNKLERKNGIGSGTLGHVHREAEKLIRALFDRYKIAENDSVDDIARMEIDFPADIRVGWRNHSQRKNKPEEDDRYDDEVFDVGDE